ncbi:hypothetical protein, partial [Bacillus toyonensis]|uniref:hypothetical protein n=1 Tax=Bacillus toyonensis TaxID=155322 RepID=UPI000C009886
LFNIIPPQNSESLLVSLCEIHMLVSGANLKKWNFGGTVWGTKSGTFLSWNRRYDILTVTVWKTGGCGDSVSTIMGSDVSGPHYQNVTEERAWAVGTRDKTKRLSGNHMMYIPN